VKATAHGSVWWKLLSEKSGMKKMSEKIKIAEKLFDNP
jgi:hypothetical protein